MKTLAISALICVAVGASLVGLLNGQSSNTKHTTETIPTWTVKDTPLPRAWIGVPYEIDLNAWMESEVPIDSSAVKWEIVSNKLPNGLSIANGHIFGVPMRVAGDLTMLITYKGSSIEAKFVLAPEAA